IAKLVTFVRFIFTIAPASVLVPPPKTLRKLVLIWRILYFNANGALVKKFPQPPSKLLKKRKELIKPTFS
ncbi:MAG: hypothetical protein IJF33_07075, partial [Clostridia bacterium]|nr:hypothetical protein [Clostridia bacterium]